VRWLAVVVVLAGCLDAKLTVCASGKVCARGDVCDDVHDLCVSPAQLTACDGAADGTTCAAAGTAGECVGGVCLAQVCGDGIIELPEVCDPPAPGMGCSFDCLSNETCGNGVVDPGEACDDGNLASHDGCDSQCRPESPQWSIVPIAPIVTDALASAYDQGRHELVHVGGGYTWTIAHGSWRIATTTSPTPKTAAAAYDSSRSRIVLFGTTNNTIDQVWSWDGTAWQAITATTPSGTGGVTGVVYSPDRDEFLILTSKSQTWSWSDAAGFVAGPAVPSTGPVPDIAYDIARSRVVGSRRNASGQPEVLELGGSPLTWTTTSAAGPHQDALLVYDATRQKVLAIGGAEYDPVNGDSYYSNVVQWSGTTWTAVATTGAFPPRALAEGGYDPGAGVVVVSGLYFNFPDREDEWWLDETSTWTESTPGHPGPGPIIVDPGHQILVLPDLDAPWRWDGTQWTQIAAGPMHTVAGVYAPAMRATIVNDGTTTWQLAAGSWTAGPPTMGSGPMAYDDEHAQVVELGAAATNTLDVSGTSWTSVGPLPMTTPRGGTLAYDATSHSLVYEDASNSAAQLVSGAWQYALCPGFSYSAIPQYRRGSVLFAPGLRDKPIWERQGGTWIQREVLPTTANDPLLGSFVPNIAVDPANDALIYYTPVPGGRVMLVRVLTSGLPDETCVPGEDADGDGATGCADPDCWLSCSPQCPFGVHCM
jgi:cysteine-rich repeat protein